MEKTLQKLENRYLQTNKEEVAKAKAKALKQKKKRMRYRQNRKERLKATNPQGESSKPDTLGVKK